jgi:hypothetical protein
MRAMVTKGGIYTWINTRENQFIEEHFSNNKTLDKKDLNEREQYIAQTLVSRGILERFVDRNSTSYALNIDNNGTA